MKDNGLTTYEVAKKHKLSPKTVYNWLNNVNPDMKDVLKENRQLKAEVKVLVELIKKLSVDCKKTDNRPNPVDHQ